jgi:DNA-binding transcriptional LysR family regulator
LERVRWSPRNGFFPVTVLGAAFEALHEACVGGLGLALLSKWNVLDELRSGTLVEVRLEAAMPQEFAIWAVYPSARLVPPKVRVFIDVLERALAQP